MHPPPEDTCWIDSLPKRAPIVTLSAGSIFARLLQQTDNELPTWGLRMRSQQRLGCFFMIAFCERSTLHRPNPRSRLACLFETEHPLRAHVHNAFECDGQNSVKTKEQSYRRAAWQVYVYCTSMRTSRFTACQSFRANSAWFMTMASSMS